MATALMFLHIIMRPCIMQRLDDRKEGGVAFICIICDYVYEPGRIENYGDEEESAGFFLGKDWQCPECGAGKSCFRELRLKNEEDTQCT